MNEQIRHKKLLALLAQKQMLSVPEIIEYLNISPATARRDITKLNQQGRLIKIRNGVESLPQAQPTGRLTHINHFDEKQRIAQAASALCQDGESVILTCGSTMMMLGEVLCNRRIQIITNFLPLANYLIEHDHEQVVIMGGQYNKSQAIMLSLHATDETFAANIVFTSGKGLTTDGLYKTDMLIANSEQRILSKNTKLVVLLDSSKLGSAVGMLFTELKNINTLITGKEADPNIIKALREKGLQVITA
ncbi:HTH-type transcriptional regulator UlaR [Necropsobacter massiliensis]|uniref:HTH-type transcriptional regulator UlaR n=1 Tax=Necropsobacter massiliensis TaxID=1400001 RepID=UPI000595E63F|nr:HTH-type transcriptional regulator UlaR [Necropsobacter massiliensis]